MNRSRRVILQSLPLLALVTACGSVSATSTSPAPSSLGVAAPSAPIPSASAPASTPAADHGATTPPPTSGSGLLAIIHIDRAGGGVETASAASTSSSGSVVDSKMRVAAGSIVYAFSGDLPVVASTGPSWSMPANQPLDDSRVAAIAAAFGVAGSVERLPADQGGGWQVGKQDGTTANLTIVDDGPLSWYFNPVMTTSTATSTCSGGVGVEDSATTEPVQTCSAPTPPAGVPTKEAALTTTMSLLSAAGIDVGGQTFVATADEWSASVTGTLELAGHRTQMTTQVFFGGGGAVVAASGFLATPVAGGDYPLVSTSEALQRLNDRDDAWLTPLGDAGVAVRDGAPAIATALPPVVDCAPLAGAASSAGETIDATPSGGTTDATATASASAATVTPAGPAPIETAAVAIAPVPSDALLCPQVPSGNDGSPAGSADPSVGAPAPDAPTTTSAPIVVTLTGVRLDIDPVYSADSSVWLLPTYVFTSADGGEYSVVAVTDQYLQHDAG